MKIVLAALCLFATSTGHAFQVAHFNSELLERVRTAARSMSGDLPEGVHYLSIAEAYRPMESVVEGGGPASFYGVIPVFQIRFAGTWVMVDAGLPEATHNARRGASPFLYRPARYRLAQRALLGAKLVVITHEHADHVAGVLDEAVRERLAPTVGLTAIQVQTLVDRSAEPLLFTPEMASRYALLEYSELRPIAPGVVLIAAPGHTPGSQLIYVLLSSGQEILLIGDISWTIWGIQHARQKPQAVSARLQENRAQIATELVWLRDVMLRTRVVVVPSHDGDWLEKLTAQGVLADTLVIVAPATAR